jgi:hypothetical protein
MQSLFQVPRGFAIFRRATGTFLPAVRVVGIMVAIAVAIPACNNTEMETEMEMEISILVGPRTLPAAEALPLIRLVSSSSHSRTTMVRHVSVVVAKKGSKLVRQSVCIDLRLGRQTTVS